MRPLATCTYLCHQSKELEFSELSWLEAQQQGEMELSLPPIAVSREKLGVRRLSSLVRDPAGPPRVVDERYPCRNASQGIACLSDKGRSPALI